MATVEDGNRWDCVDCTGRGLAAKRGCSPGTESVVPIYSGGTLLGRCPKAWERDDVSEETKQLFSDVTLFRVCGAMPNDGGILDQSSMFVDALNVVTREEVRRGELCCKSDGVNAPKGRNKPQGRGSGGKRSSAVRS